MATLPDDPIEEIECPVCTMVMVPPINQCVNNHNICQSCRPKLKHCHLCRGKITRARNFYAEVLSKSIKHPCKFQESGCPGEYYLDLKGQHESTCTYRHRKRPIIDTSADVVQAKTRKHIEKEHPCKFQESGCPEQYCLDLKGQHESTCMYRHRKCPIIDCCADVVQAEIRKHIEKEHAAKILPSKVIEKIPSGFDPDFLIAHEHLSAVFRLWRNNNGGLFMWYTSPGTMGCRICAAFVGTLEEARNYKYKITVSSLKSVAMMTACYRCPSYLEIIEKGGIENMTCSALVPQELFDECKDSNGKYCIQQEIIEIKKRK